MGYRVFCRGPSREFTHSRLDLRYGKRNQLCEIVPVLGISLTRAVFRWLRQRQFNQRGAPTCSVHNFANDKHRLLRFTSQRTQMSAFLPQVSGCVFYANARFLVLTIYILCVWGIAHVVLLFACLPTAPPTPVHPRAMTARLRRQDCITCEQTHRHTGFVRVVGCGRSRVICGMNLM